MRWPKGRLPLNLLAGDYPASPAQVELFEKVFPEVRLASGVYRMTFRGRFELLDQHVNDLLARHLNPDAPLRIEDWAASDCLTSSEWAAGLFRRFPLATVTASDLTLFLVEVRLTGERSIIMEPGGEPLQYIRPPFVVSISPPEPRLSVVNRLLARYARAQARRIARIWKLPKEWFRGEGPVQCEQQKFGLRRISLIHPEAEALRRSTARFAIRTQSVFERAPARCHVIRTMNILNLSYFTKEKLIEGARAVLASLEPGGVWITGRTYQDHPPGHNLSVFREENGEFRLMERCGEGFEIEPLVLSQFGRAT